jgi:hypothetical protein
MPTLEYAIIQSILSELASIAESASAPDFGTLVTWLVGQLCLIGQFNFENPAASGHVCSLGG